MYEYLTTESVAKRAKNLEKALTVTFSPPFKLKSSVQTGAHKFHCCILRTKKVHLVSFILVLEYDKVPEVRLGIYCCIYSLEMKQLFSPKNVCFRLHIDKTCVRAVFSMSPLI